MCLSFRASTRRASLMLVENTPKEPRMIRTTLAIALLSAASLGAQAAPASLSDYGYNVITGSGIGDGGFTVGIDSQNLGISVALRARERNPVPTNNTGWQSDGIYKQAAGSFGPNLALWNFDWSIAIGHSTHTLGQYKYQIGIDYNNSTATSFLEFDPVKGGVFDNSFGDTGAKNSLPTTPSGGGFETTDPLTYADSLDLVTGFDLVQNSWNLGFFDSPATPFTFDANAGGTYSIFLRVLDETGASVASTSIDVVVSSSSSVPEPGSLALLGAALAGLALVRRTRKS